MEKLFLCVVILCALVGILTGRTEAVAAAVLDSGRAAVALALTLAGAYSLWCGVLELMRQSGLISWLSKGFRPLLRRLFPTVKQDGDAENAIATNFAANLLGMGNAATPAGLMAMRALREEARNTSLPTDAMCLFLILNSSSLQLIPTTLISVRAAAGSTAPADIVLPSLLASIGSTLSALALALAWRRFRCLLQRRKRV